ncbi:hypothetical protein Q5P01_023196 [Channa striata]|uniref:Uncharacterized protein n=1 Tax=Channa striata TaxID=64152 RepID=A0AA88J1S2_CHASR|nr:hypothetical protein Q5P01_023196 [Channa striata]
MSAAVRRVFTGVTGIFLNGAISIHKRPAAVRLNSVRPLALTCQRSAKSKKPPDDKREVNNEPIKFSTSKASHRTWKVESSMGSQFQRPWGRVLSVSLFVAAFLLWCALRGETDVDAQLEKQLYDHLPDLIADEEEEHTQNKSS